MPISLTTPFAVSSGSKLVLTRVRPDEEDNALTCLITLRTAANGTPPDMALCVKGIAIRNGMSDRLSRWAPGAGASCMNLLVLSERVVSTPTGLTDAIAAFNQSRKHLEDYLLQVGIIDASLAGT